MSKKPDKPSTLLRRAKRVLKERGWHQGSFTDEFTGKVCVLGAINIALGAPPTYLPPPDNPMYKIWKPAYEALRDCIDKATPHYTSVAEYNDSVAKTEKDIQAILNCSIKRLETSN